MISSKKIMAMAKKWRRLAALGRRRLMSSTSIATAAGHVLADKGHFIVYTTDERRFMVPLEYLKSDIFRELFSMSEDLFGFPADDDHIRLPCDAVFMEHVMSLLRRRRVVSRDVERDLLVSITAGQCSGNSLVYQYQYSCQPLLLRGF